MIRKLVIVQLLEASHLAERTWARVAVVQAPTELEKLTIAATGSKP